MLRNPTMKTSAPVPSFASQLVSAAPVKPWAWRKVFSPGTEAATNSPSTKWSRSSVVLAASPLVVSAWEPAGTGTSASRRRTVVGVVGDGLGAVDAARTGALLGGWLQPPSEARAKAVTTEAAAAARRRAHMFDGT